MSDDIILAELHADAAALRRKQQRKGVEYRMREAPPRPELDAAKVDFRGIRHAERSVTQLPMVASGKDTRMSTSAKSSGSVQLPPVNSAFDAYDPARAGDKEQRMLETAVEGLRTTASELSYRKSQLEKQREAAENALELLRRQDEVSKDREDGLAAIAAARSRNDALEAQLVEVEAYRHTLEHMLNRNRQERVASLETQKAFEEALELNRRELALKQSMLQSVQKSRDDEVTALHRMHASVQEELKALDKKLEARRKEVATRSEQLKVRLVRAQAAAALSAKVVGVTSIEEMRELEEKLAALEADLSAARTFKIRNQNEADAAESDYNQLRFAAGVPATADHLDAASADMASTVQSGHSDNDDTQEVKVPDYAAPDTEAIVTRFNRLEIEMKQIDEQVTDFSQRLKALRMHEAQLQAMKQPMARDESDEAGEDMSEIDALRSRGEQARRAVDALEAEFRAASNVRLQLHQSIALLHRRVEGIPHTVPATFSDVTRNDLMAIDAHLAEDSRKLPSRWCLRLHDSLAASVRAILRLQVCVDPTAVAANVAETRAWLEGGGAKSQASASASRAVSPSERQFGSPVQFTDSAGATGFKVRKPQAVGTVHAPDIEAVIETLITTHDFAVRVPSDKRRNNDGGNGIVTAKVLSDAAQAFERGVREATSRVLVAQPVETPTSSDPLSISAARARRRNSRIMIATAYAAADSLLPVHDGDGEDLLLSALTGKTDYSTEQPASRLSQRSGNKADAVHVPKPKPRELHRLLAAALQMSGEDVDDMLLGRRETDEIATREQLKRSTTASLRREAARRQAASIATGKDKEQQHGFNASAAE